MKDCVKLPLTAKRNKWSFPVDLQLYSKAGLHGVFSEAMRPRDAQPAATLHEASVKLCTTSVGLAAYLPYQAPMTTVSKVSPTPSM